MIQYPVFLINLDHATARRDRMAQRLATAEIGFRRIAAVDGSVALQRPIPEYSEAAAKDAFGRKLFPGELGCYLSHLAAARELVESGEPFALVLEDDANVPADLVGRI